LYTTSKQILHSDHLPSSSCECTVAVLSTDTRLVPHRLQMYAGWCWSSNPSCFPEQSAHLIQRHICNTTQCFTHIYELIIPHQFCQSFMLLSFFTQLLGWHGLSLHTSCFQKEETMVYTARNSVLKSKCNLEQWGYSTMSNISTKATSRAKCMSVVLGLTWIGVEDQRRNCSNADGDDSVYKEVYSQKYKCIQRDESHLIKSFLQSKKMYIPYFPAYSARVIYTKKIWNHKKWTCAVYIRKISDR
jgi:hypothetical protein